jgi:hypothetical protein
MRRTLLLVPVVGVWAAMLTFPAASVDAERFRRSLDKDLSDQAAVRSVLLDIDNMREPELRTFAHYLAECNSPEGAGDDNPQNQHSCEVARIEYQLEFEADRALDRWMSARAVFFSDLVTKTVGDVPSDKDKWSKEVEAILNARSLIEVGVAGRFKELRAPAK